MRPGDTPLTAACRRGRLVPVKALLQGGANVNEPNEPKVNYPYGGASPLFIASHYGHLHVVSALLSAGAAVNQAHTKNGATPLIVACQNGHLEVVSTLLSAGAAIDQASTDNGVTPLLVACMARGCHLKVVSTLLSAGAAIDKASTNGFTPLLMAAIQGNNDVVTALCSAGAAVDQDMANGVTPMRCACVEGHLETVQKLASFGAARDPVDQAHAATNGHDDLAAWLASSHQWSTPLHHLSIIGAERARALLRAGADLHARADAAGPTPLSLARALRAAGGAADGSAAQLLLMAAEPWSPRTHALFPAGARAFAAELLLLGHQLSRQPRFEGEEASLSDSWVDVVMPLAVMR